MSDSHTKSTETAHMDADRVRRSGAVGSSLQNHDAAPPLPTGPRSLFHQGYGFSRHYQQPISRNYPLQVEFHPQPLSMHFSSHQAPNLAATYGYQASEYCLYTPGPIIYMPQPSSTTHNAPSHRLLATASTSIGATPTTATTSLRAEAPEFMPGQSMVSWQGVNSLSQEFASSENSATTAVEDNGPRPFSQQTPVDYSLAPYRKEPAAAWDDRLSKPRAWEHWKLSPSDIRRGLLAYLKPNGTWYGNHPAIVRGLDDAGNISIFTGTSFTESGGTIWLKFKDIRKPEVHRDHCHQYLLIDDGATAAHYSLPVLRLEGGEKLPKTTYVSMVMGSISVRREDLARWSHGKKFGNYHITAGSMDAAEEYFSWYTQMEEDKRKRRQEERQRAARATKYQQRYQQPGS